jgi:hypothetical protein
MNIFYLDNDPVKCAEMHVDKHVVKMIVEYAQLLSTAHRILDGVPVVSKRATTGRQQTTYHLDDDRDGVLYRATHFNHPSAVWVRKRESHYRCLFNLWIALMDEYTYRYGKIHSTSRLVSHLNKPPKNIKFGDGFDQPTPAMPDKYIVPGDSVQSYKNYYLGAKTEMFRWKNRDKPYWI